MQILSRVGEALVGEHDGIVRNVIFPPIRHLARALFVHGPIGNISAPFRVLPIEEKRLKIAFLSHRTPGHLHSTTTLARRLKARAHDVVVISVLDAEPFVRAAQVPFVPYAEQDLPLGSSRKMMDQLSRLQGQAALDFIISSLEYLVRFAFRDLPRIIREERVDALVLDQVHIGLGFLPMHLGMPYATQSNAVHVDFSGNTPPCVADLPYEETPDGLARNRQAVRKLLHSLEPVTRTGREYVEQCGLNVDWSDPFADVSKLAWVTQTPREFDFKTAVWPPFLYHTGPFHDGLGRINLDFPEERLTGDALIYASLGTLQNGLESVFSMIAEAVGERPGLQLVMSIGPTLDEKQIQNLPRNAIVVKSAPQIPLLKQSVLCITHAGLNTTLESLTQGVPMVAMPITSDQPGVARRIAYTKTGAYVPFQGATAPRVRSLIDEVLDNPEYRHNASAMRRAIAEIDGLERAVDILEQAFHAQGNTTEKETLAAR